MPESAPKPGWYPDPSDASRRRYWDGHTWGPLEPTDQPPPPPAPPPNKKRRGLLIFTAVLALFFVIAVLSNNDKQTSSGPSSTSGPAPSASAAAPTMAGIGQEVRDGKFAFVVNSIDRSKTAGNPDNEL